jgi:hypothetical protein
MFFLLVMNAVPFLYAATQMYGPWTGYIYGPSKTTCQNAPVSYQGREWLDGQWPNLIGDGNHYYDFLAWHAKISGYIDCQAMIVDADIIKTNGLEYYIMLAEAWFSGDGVMYIQIHDPASATTIQYTRNISPTTSLNAWYLLVYYLPSTGQLEYQWWWGTPTSNLILDVKVACNGYWTTLWPVGFWFGDPEGTYGGSGYWNGAQAIYLP